VDTLTRAARSQLMRKIKAANTSPELIVRKLVRRTRRNFQLNSSRLPGSPDLAFFRLHKAIFVHGCFWHRHRDRSCRRSNLPKTNRAYWLPKLKKNEKRDRDAQRMLRKMGWKFLVVWECQCKDTKRLSRRLSLFLLQL
jgi:DNA mismatch endonuclease (patch repair protein)